MSRSRRLLLAIVAIAGPVLACAGSLLFPADTDDPVQSSALVVQHAGTEILAGTLSALGAVCMIGLYALFAFMTPGRGRTLTLLGVGIGTLGAAVFSGTMLTTVCIQVSLPQDLDVQVTRTLDGAALANLPWFSAYLLVVGILLGSIGVLVARAVPVWLGVLLIVGVLLTYLAGNFGPISELVWLPAIVAVVLTAVRFVRGEVEPARRAPVVASAF